MAKWPKKLTRKALAERGIINTWDMLAHGEPAITYQPPHTRACMPSRWRVWRRGVEIADQPWYDRGGKTFGGVGEGWRTEALEIAKAWASKEFGFSEWVRNPFGEWVPAQVPERLLSTAAAAAPASGRAS